MLSLITASHTINMCISPPALSSTHMYKQQSNQHKTNMLFLYTHQRQQTQSRGSWVSSQWAAELRYHLTSARWRSPALGAHGHVHTSQQGKRLRNTVIITVCLWCMCVFIEHTHFPPIMCFCLPHQTIKHKYTLYPGINGRSLNKAKWRCGWEGAKWCEGTSGGCLLPFCCFL